MNKILASNLTSAQAVFFIQQREGYIDVDEKHPNRYLINSEMPLEDPEHSIGFTEYTKNTLKEQNETDKLRVKKHLEKLTLKIPNTVGINFLVINGFIGSIFLKSYNKNELNDTINTLLDWSNNLELKTSWKECITPPVWHTEITFNFYYLLGH